MINQHIISNLYSCQTYPPSLGSPFKENSNIDVDYNRNRN